LNLKELKKNIVLAVHKAGEGHIPSAFSVLDIIWVLYDSILKIDPKKPKSKNRDYFILSKGHASLALYAVLAKKGFFPESELKKYCEFTSKLGGHPDRNKIPGVEVSTGSLGHGLPMAVGIAIGLKIKKMPNMVYALIGDGECNEGSIWESLLLAKEHKLTNLYCIVDDNRSSDRALNLGDIERKFKSFGWDSKTIDGHSHREIKKVMKTRKLTAPTVIIARTIKGKGISIMENNPEWHHKTPNHEEIAKIIAEIN
jgi:transketolase